MCKAAADSAHEGQVDSGVAHLVPLSDNTYSSPSLQHYGKRSSRDCTFIRFLANAHAFNKKRKIDDYPVHCWKVVLKADSTSWGQYFFENMVRQGFLHCAAM